MSRGAPGLYAITDRKLLRAPLEKVLDTAFRAGLAWVQVREKDLPPRELLHLVRQAVGVARGHGARVLVNDRADVAVAAGAQGVQLTELSMPAAELREAFPALLVGASVHSLYRARQAEAGGADFLVLGPIFETPSKRAFGAPLGLGTLREVASAVAIPVIAVGGITPGRVARCRAAGAGGVAAIRGLLGEEDVEAAVRAYLAAGAPPDGPLNPPAASTRGGRCGRPAPGT